MSEPIRKGFSRRPRADVEVVEQPPVQPVKSNPLLAAVLDLNGRLKKLEEMSTVHAQTIGNLGDHADRLENELAILKARKPEGLWDRLVSKFRKQ